MKPTALSVIIAALLCLFPLEQAKAQHENFGFSSANSSRYIVVGDPFYDASISLPNAGSIRVIDKLSWTVTGLYAGAASNRNLGYSVDVSDPTSNGYSYAVVGVPGDGFQPNTGKVNVYEIRPTSPGVATVNLISQLYNPHTPDPGYDRFGSSVAISEDGQTIAIGSPGDDRGGAVYVARRSVGPTGIVSYNVVATTVLSPVSGEVNFGSGVDVMKRAGVSEYYIVAGANSWDNPISHYGVVGTYRFTPSTLIISHMQTLTPSSGQVNGMGFGTDVAAHGGHMVVGAPMGDRAFTYSMDPVTENWSLVDTIVGPAHSWDDESFGFSVSLHGNDVAIGVPFNDMPYLGSTPTTNTGSVYMLRYNWDKPSYDLRILNYDQQTNYDSFGISSSIYSGQIVIGAGSFLGEGPDDNRPGFAMIYNINDIFAICAPNYIYRFNTNSNTPISYSPSCI